MTWPPKMGGAASPPWTCGPLLRVCGTLKTTTVLVGRGHKLPIHYCAGRSALVLAAPPTAAGGHLLGPTVPLTRAFRALDEHSERKGEEKEKRRKK
jgi:hypothetical protein